MEHKFSKIRTPHTAHRTPHTAAHESRPYRREIYFSAAFLRPFLLLLFPALLLGCDPPGGSGGGTEPALQPEPPVTVTLDTQGGSSISPYQVSGQILGVSNRAMVFLVHKESGSIFGTGSTSANLYGNYTITVPGDKTGDFFLVAVEFLNFKVRTTTVTLTGTATENMAALEDITDSGLNKLHDITDSSSTTEVSTGVRSGIVRYITGSSNYKADRTAILFYEKGPSTAKLYVSLSNNRGGGYKAPADPSSPVQLFFFPIRLSQTGIVHYLHSSEFTNLNITLIKF